MNNQIIFQLLQASLFTDEDFTLLDWKSVFDEMKEHAVAAMPCEWLKQHQPIPEWNKFCFLQQGQWVRVMHGQEQIVRLFEDNGISSVIIKGAAASIYYPHPSLRSMGDVDIMVKREDLEKAAKLLEDNDYILTHEKTHCRHHYNYTKDKVTFELHKRLAVIDDNDENLLSLFEEGIDNRFWCEIGEYRFPVLPSDLNGLVLIFHINQHLREGLGLRQIIDWMMYVNSLTDESWEALRILLRVTGMERLAITVTVMCQRYLGLQKIVEEDESLPVEELKEFLMEKGNFGRKAGIEGKTAAFSISATERGGFFKRLQDGGLSQWGAARKYIVLRPFAWIYQSFRILGILLRNKTSPRVIFEQRKHGIEQRQLMESLGLRVDRTVIMH